MQSNLFTKFYFHLLTILCLSCASTACATEEAEHKQLNLNQEELILDQDLSVLLRQQRLQNFRNLGPAEQYSLLFTRLPLFNFTLSLSQRNIDRIFNRIIRRIGREGASITVQVILNQTLALIPLLSGYSEIITRAASGQRLPTFYINQAGTLRYQTELLIIAYRNILIGSAPISLNPALALAVSSFINVLFSINDTYYANAYYQISGASTAFDFNVALTQLANQLTLSINAMIEASPDFQ